jgi:hypothetical protein
MRNATDAAPGELTAAEEESTQRNREVDLKTQRGDVVFFSPFKSSATTASLLLAPPPWPGTRAS